jgi:hypothetical protein
MQDFCKDVWPVKGEKEGEVRKEGFVFVPTMFSAFGHSDFRACSALKNLLSFNHETTNRIMSSVLTPALRIGTLFPSREEKQGFDIEDEAENKNWEYSTPLCDPQGIAKYYESVA